jgi:GAF domain-containing protein
VHTLVFEQGRAVRLDDYADVSGAAAEVAREFGIRAAIGVPISVEGRLWGVMSLASTRERPLPASPSGSGLAPQRPLPAMLSREKRIRGHEVGVSSQ